MHIWNADPFILTLVPLVQKVAPRRAFATFMVKATFRIRHDHPPFPLSEPDVTLPKAIRYVAGELNQALRPDLPSPDVPDPEMPGNAESLCDVPPMINLVESDAVPFKPTADVIVVADAHAPGGTPVTALEVGMAVGKRVKTLLVAGDHYWVEGRLTPFAPFTSMPISYTRAFGGPDFPRNPAGKGRRVERDQRNRRFAAMPNIVRPGEGAGGPEAELDPAGFGPLSRMWPQRASGKAGTFDDTWKKTRHPWFPVDFDWSIYNCAPHDQRFEGYLRGDEPLAFKNLHPAHPLYRFTLPGIRPRVFFKELVDRQSGPPPKEPRNTATAAEVTAPQADAPGTAAAKADAAPADPIADASKKATESVQAWTAKLQALTSPIVAGPVKLPVFDDPGPYRWREVALNLDTVVVDLRAEKLTIVWRGLREIPSPRFEGVSDIYVTHEDLGTEPASAKEHLAALEAMKDLLRHAFSEGMSDPEEVADEIERRTAQIPGLLDEAMAVGKHFDGIAEKVAEKPTAAATTPKGTGFTKAEVAAAQARSAPRSPPATLRPAPPGGVDPDAMGSLLGQLPADAKELALADIAHLKAGGAPEALPSKLAAENIFPSTKAEIMKTLDPAKAELEEKLGPLVGGKLLGDQYDSRDDFVQAIRDGKDMRACTAIGLDLSYIDFSDLDFTNGNFYRTNFAGSILRNARLAHAKFTSCRLLRVDFSGSDLSNAQFTRAELGRNRFVGCTLAQTNLIGQNLKGMDFSGCRGAQAYLLEADLTDARFVGATLTYPVFAKAILRGTDFTDATLERGVFLTVDATGAIFTRATLDHACMGVRSIYAGASFMNARLNRVNLDIADLRGADFGGAVMRNALVNEVDARGTVFENADLADTTMEEARLIGASFVNANLLRTSFTRSDLQDADLSHGNLYNAQFFDTHLKHTAVSGSFLKGTVLEGEQPGARPNRG